MSWRIWVSALIREPSGRALGHDQDPDGLDRTVSALGLSMRSARQRGSSGLDGVEGIGLAALSAGLAVLPIDFDDLDPGSSEEAGDARPHRTRSLPHRPW